MKNVSLLTLVALGLSFLAGSVSAADLQLKKYVNESARFEALMPDGVSERWIEAENLLESEYRSEVEVSGGKMEVRVRVLIPIKMDDQDLLDQYGASMVAQAEEQFQSLWGTPSRIETVTQFGAKGKHFEFQLRTRDGRPVVVRRRVMFDGMRLYQVIVQGTPAMAQSQASDLFLDSVGPMDSDSAIKTARRFASHVR
ncbi:MAG: hypothetical protein AAGD07_19870 [Planctomycetota bacterium]